MSQAPGREAETVALSEDLRGDCLHLRVGRVSSIAGDAAGTTATARPRKDGQVAIH